MNKRCAISKCFLAIVLLTFFSVAVFGASGTSSEGVTLSSKIDDYVKAAPKKVGNSVQSLADYLSKAAKTDADKSQAAYSWIVDNIAYDVEGYNSGNYPDPSPENVLKTKKAVCGGYASLYEALTNALGLESVTIIGFSRGSGYSIGSKLENDPDHAWNAVKIDDKWYLLDPTWATGFINSQNEFTFQRNDFYYLTPPKEFVYDHLPKENKWQLVDAPITKEQYQNLVYLRPGFFRNSLQIASHKEGVIKGSSNFTISLGSPNDVVITAVVNKGQMETDLASTFVQRSNDKLMLNTTISKSGDYILRLFAKQKQSKTYDWAADYMVKAPANIKPEPPLPQALTTFNDRDAFLYSPMSGVLKSGDNVTFKISAPGAESVFVVVEGNSNFTPLAKNGNVFEGIVKVQGDKILVAAKYSGSESAFVLLKYKVS